MKVLLFALLLITYTFGDTQLEILENDGYDKAAKTLKIAQIILGKDKKEQLKEVQSLEAEAQVAWDDSRYKDLNFMSSASTQVLIFNVYDNTIKYLQKTNQSYLAIPYLKKGMDKAYEEVFLTKYFYYASVLNGIYIELGLYGLSLEHLSTAKEVLGELYEYEGFEESKGSFSTLQVHFALFELKMDTALASKNMAIISYEELKQEYEDLQKSYKVHNRLPFLKYENTTSASLIQTRGRTLQELEESRYYQDMDLLKNFSAMFVLYEDIDTSIKILTTLDDHYFANIGFKDDADMAGQNAVTSVMMSSFFSLAPMDGTKERAKANFLRYPLLNQLWQTTNTMQISLLKGKSTQAAKYLNTAQDDLNELLANYKELEYFYYQFDEVDKEIYKYKMIRAKVLEKSGQLAQAQSIYKHIVDTNEEQRESIPIELRKNFFNGFGKNAYLGLIRISTLMYEQKKSPQNFNQLLNSINRIYARELKELSNRYEIQNKIELSSLQKYMKKDELIYILFDVDDSIVLASISKTDTDAQLLQKPKSFEKNLKYLKEELTQNYHFDNEKMKEFSSLLFAQLDKYKGIKKLHILSDGIVTILPFDIYLDSKSKMLFENYKIDYLSDLSTQNMNKSVQNTMFLGVADPTYSTASSESSVGQYFVQLPETRVEVEHIAKNFENRTLLYGKDATESKIKHMDLLPYNFIHFATHGILSGEIREVDESALVLSSEDGEDSLLSMSEVAKLKLNADLTVLSACNTGSGKYFRGEGVSGIGKAFKIAGSKNLLVSLWPVDSFATQKLMESFYANINKGENFTLALHNAKVSLKKDKYTQNDTTRGLKLAKSKQQNLDGYKNPYFWSAFILIKQ